MSAIMISYQWDSQPEAIRIKDALEADGYDVWMDLDDMRGNIYQKMAEGVENAAVILVCMSTKYENSVNCNRELQFSQDKRKQLIPIMIEAGYRPGGALGLIIAGLKYVDFSNPGDFDDKMVELRDEITHYCKPTLQPTESAPKAASETATTGDYNMKLGVVEARAESWDGAATALVDKLRSRKLKRGQVVSVSAHNNGKNENAIFSAFYDINAPGQGDLEIHFDSQNSSSSWSTIYQTACEQAATVKLNDIIGISGSCNMDRAVFYVFSQVPSPVSDSATVEYVESRADTWEEAADGIIGQLEANGVSNGQVLNIDAHNNGEGEAAIFSAHYSKDLPGKGPLSISYKAHNGSSAWATFYQNCCNQASKLKRNVFISITASINTPETSVMYMFYYDN
ncbi:uncharacterized protein [Clytia hemisphaerica]|uniref:TIR domain-containing protein n=1 Tax=Clytia hemisphaerica TaxID=252671 RepID=A0A7M6DKW7_9CNID|eukprot:TCONS_00066214-protein